MFHLQNNHDGQHRRSSRIVDVDQLSVKRDRRRKIKKRVMSLFHPFQHHGGDAAAHPVIVTPVKQRAQSFVEPRSRQQRTRKEFQPAREEWRSPSLPQLGLVSDDHSSVSSATYSESESLAICHSEEDNMVFVVPHEQNEVAIIEEDEEEEVVIGEEKELVSEFEEEDEEDVPAPCSYEKDLGMIVLLVVAHSLWNQQLHADEEEESAVEDELPTVACLPQALLDEIVHHKHLDAVIIESTTEEEEEQETPEVINEQEEEDTEEEEADDSEEEETDVIPEETKDTEVLALQDKCDNLITLTELLSKKLVESTLTKKQEQITKRKETKLYEQMIRKLEEQHRLEYERLVGDRKYLEGQLQRHKVESVPPIVKSKSVRYLTKKEEEENAQVASLRRRRRRHSLMDNLVTPIELCSKGNTSTRASFTMASTMIMQNKLLPAMLSAVARGTQPDFKK